MSREPAEARLGRLLAIVPWIAAHDGPTIEEVCRRFGVGEKDLLADLNLLFMCGVYPFTPDVLIDVNIADGRVWISMADYFRRPLRLNPQEALALVSAGRAFLGVPGADPDGALATALDKLENVLGVGPGEALEVELAEIAPGVLDTLRAAVGEQRRTRIGYYSFGRDGHSTRVVHPWQVFNSAGQWYLSGWCENVSAPRTFRLDRITAIETLPDTFDTVAPEPGRAPAPYSPDPDDARWVLELDPPAHWIAEQYPNEAVESGPGPVLRVTLRTGSRAWLERLLLRAGPDARVVEGDPSVAPAAATRILARYQA
ncbi:MAG TPA: WYL domain-containing protein [Acidimicrobiales bacterium]|nr:WYL domain-containing protein [Acidimicrobiales bacterium]